MLLVEPVRAAETRGHSSRDAAGNKEPRRANVQSIRASSLMDDERKENGLHIKIHEGAQFEIHE